MELQSITADDRVAVAQANPLARLLARLGPDFTLFFFFLGIYAALGVIYGATFPVLAESSIALTSGIAAVLVAIRFTWRARSIVRNAPGARSQFMTGSREILRDWAPMILLTVVYENLHGYTGLIRKIPIDAQLYALDVRVFGVEPSVWAGRFASSTLTEWFGFTYNLYFVLPMVLATLLALRAPREDFREFATAIVLHMCTGFLLFLVFPAGPPRFYGPLLDGAFRTPLAPSLTGLYELTQGGMDLANPISSHSSFPSMHCASSMLTLLYAWRFGRAILPERPRLLFWGFLPFVVSLWMSTVYLRHHWVPDCVAGIALGIACYIAVPRLRRAWPGSDRDRDDERDAGEYEAGCQRA
jgi:membrane-associated phospholipid phosphatase